MSTMTLTEIDCIAPPINDEDRPHYVACDYCFETGCDDIFAGMSFPHEIRTFYHLEPGDLSVCEHCIGKIADE